MSQNTITPLLLTWLALMILLALTVTSALIEMGILNPVLNISIAAVKTVLIGLFFMHLKGATNLVRLAAGAGLFWLLLMFGLVLSDYANQL